MQNMVDDTRRLAYGSMGEQLNFLAADAAAGATELTMTLDVGSITPGSTISSGLNVWYVIGSVASQKKVIVHPGIEGSTPVAATTNDVVMLKPRVTDWYLFNTVNDVIRSMSSPSNGLYAEGVWSNVADSLYGVYAVPAEAKDMLSILRVRVNPLSDNSIPYYDLPPQSVEWQPENNTIRLRRTVPSAATLEFLVKLPLVPADALTDDVMVKCGLSESMVDIPPLGAAVALLRSTEARRSQIGVQGDARRAEEVPGGSNSSIARELDRDYKARVGEEFTRLHARNPYRVSF
jgi:hypothetical protein